MLCGGYCVQEAAAREKKEEIREPEHGACEEGFRKRKRGKENGGNWGQLGFLGGRISREFLLQKVVGIGSLAGRQERILDAESYFDCTGAC